MSHANLFATVEEINPAQAAQYLAFNTKRNRNLSERLVKQYAEDMLDGEWSLTHQGIAFDENGELIDGQHRLSAIIVANKPIKMMVSRGVKQDACRDLDSGRKRNDAEQLRFAYGENHSNKSVAVMRILAEHHGMPAVSVAWLGAHLNKHGDNIFTLQNNRRGLSLSPVSAAISAYLISGGKFDVALEFADIFQNGFATKLEHAPIIALRNFVVSGNSPAHGGSGRRELFIIAGVSLHRFVNGTCQKRIAKARNKDGKLINFPFNFKL